MKRVFPSLSMFLIKSSFVFSVILVALFPAVASAVEWSDILDGLKGDSSYSYEGGSAVISGDTLTITGGTIENADLIISNWNSSVRNILFQNVKIENPIDGLVIGPGSQPGDYRVEFDKDTSLKVYQLGVSTFSDNSSPDDNVTNLNIINNGSIQTTASDYGKNQVFIWTTGEDEVTFINNGSITTHLFHAFVFGNTCLTIEQNGICTTFSSVQSFGLSVHDEGILSASNTGRIIGDMSVQAEDNASMFVSNSGSVSGEIAYYTTSTKNAMSFHHSGSVGKNINLLLRGDYDFGYSNTGSASEGMFLEVWGNTTINGTHKPTPGTPEMETLYLYPYFTITSEEETLTKAKVMYDQLKPLSVDRMNTYDIFVRNRFQITDGPLQDDYHNVLHYYEFFDESRNQEYWGNGDLTFATTGDYDLLRRVTVDQEILPASAYTAWEGSTYIKLHEEYLNTLAPGRHLLSVEYLGGNVRTGFTVFSEDSLVIDLPKTGDDSRLALWLMLSLVSLIIFVNMRRKRRMV